MPQKQATFMVLEYDERCEEVRRFAEEAGVRLEIRNLRENPPSVRELERMFGHNPLNYFVNPGSSDYHRLGLDKGLPPRAELLGLISANPGLLQTPIIQTARLLTIGCNKERIADVLRINHNGDGPDSSSHQKMPRITRRALPSKK